MTDLHYRIREAIPADNEQLIELTRRCPTSAQLEIYADRYPNFFAMNHLQGEIAHVYVAEMPEGALVGCAAFTEKSVMKDGRLVQNLHFGDLRTDPSKRRLKVGAAFLKVYVEMLRSGRFDHGYCELLNGNAAVVKFQGHFPQDIHWGYEGQYNSFQLIPARSYKTANTLTYRRATEQDLPALAKHLNATLGRSYLAPSFSEQWLRIELNRHSSFNINCIWLAVDSSGNIAASLGLWDQSSIRRTVATKFSQGIKTFVRGLALCGLLWELPPIPKEGMALRYAICRWPAAKEDAVVALQNLCKHLLNEVRREGNLQFISIGFHNKDPLEKALDGLWKVPERIEIYSHWYKPDTQTVSGLKQRFIDLSLI